MVKRTSGLIAIMYLSKSPCVLKSRRIPFCTECTPVSPIYSSSVICCCHDPDLHCRRTLECISKCNLKKTYQIKIRNWEDMGCFKEKKIIAIWLSPGDDTSPVSCTNSTAKIFSLFTNAASETFSLYILREKGNNEHEDQGLAGIGL